MGLEAFLDKLKKNGHTVIFLNHNPNNVCRLPRYPEHTTGVYMFVDFEGSVYSYRGGNWAKLYVNRVEE